MKKPSSRIREEIAKLQEQLRQAETREAERIGRIALRAGLGEIEVDEPDLQSAFEKLAARFREGSRAAIQGRTAPPHTPRAPQGGAQGA
ncbi:conjugal transfer protein TraC [Ensifer sp.]|uniref:conjugal transfer protein TraC n=1 Tax=Ensifer sp. TaxID=1872086 RepID=UPI00289CFC39|nr:conjugal transfer protein TraC [Ensifer sp.]